MHHSLLFSGHMIDHPQRSEPRFPANKEAGVTHVLEKVILEIISKKEVPVKGISGGACGGDIIFHELCAMHGIKTEMYLALPRNEFKKESVSFAGKDWDVRFEKLVEEIPVHILQQGKYQGNVWHQANLWMLSEAMKYGAEHATLISLWNMKSGDGAGGTNDMVEAARERGIGVKVVDVGEIG